MSKTYEALLRTEREKAAGKGLAKPVPGPEIGRYPDVHPERFIGRVPVHNLIAKPDSVLAEQLRKLQGIVVANSITRSLRLLLVTSCMPGEGKTFVALNLSAIIAKGLDDSAILIDADLRKRNLSSLLGLQNAPGLSTVLEERATVEETLLDTEIEGLAILGAGSSPSNPAELIASTRMKSLVQQLAATHNDSYIIIDSTPIALSSEANVLSQMVDGIILVIMSDKTRRDVVKREIKTIASEKILGVVLNCAEFETSDYYHGYYKGYYGRKKE